MDSPENFEVAIIGAGVAGLSLALSLARHNITCTIYEKRPQGLSQGGSITLFPNSLRILDSLGVYSTIHGQGFDMSTTIVRDSSYKHLSTIPISDPSRYGYAALRIRRDAVLSSLVSEARKHGIPINYEHNLVEIVEHDGGVTCWFANGVDKSVSLVVGADGLRSKTREVSFPNAPAPTYTGQAGIMWSAPRSALKYPDQEISQAGAGSEAALMVTPQGVVLFVPDSKDGNDMRIGSQRSLPERDVAGWKELGGDKSALARALRDTSEEIPEPVRSAMEYAEAADKNEFFLWPFYSLSTVDGWISKAGKGRVVLIGDAAHAFPPSGGQGAGMAVEDADGLGIVLGMENGLSVQEKLASWLRWRMKRIERVAEYTANIGKSRVAPVQPKEGEGTSSNETKPANSLVGIDAMAWLYDWKPKEQLEAWVANEREL
jgi:2-polyprenyl-6-methoxyphenol hydroxylase-like FAD-dependent oxidoreductase